MALGTDYSGQDCSLARALELVGERWTPLILRDAFVGVRRYRDFLDHLDIPRAVLAARLQALVDAGVMAKERYQDSPPREEYVLTAKGRELWPALHLLGQWGEQHLTERGPRRLYTHLPCGSRLRNGSCPSCGAVELEDVEVRPGPGLVSTRTDAVSVALREPRRLLDPLRTS
ncbi:winged helix-turn-helix transcriptional regulator [Jiangella anatolica]|uniref:ArsR family transcriptional regulator n=1 Tax=Jiangella anatolica TaxID=2670374 RepID=A0A2W2BZR7_9ACTN|nr:helix-turn-helix domain-containing protein [Jiangella anatolica]PZF85348.1 ArsR family transcriptional regulator [Jiangella anatolica]